MVTDENIRKLVATLRGIAKRNVENRHESENPYWHGQSDGRADAYNFAADWLEKLIPLEADNVQVS